MKNILTMEKEIALIYRDCLAIGKNVEEQSNVRLGFSRGKMFVFNNEKLLEHASTIFMLLLNLEWEEQLKRYNDLKKDKTGKNWTDLNYYLDILIAMANALGWLETITVANDEQKDYIVKNLHK